MVAELSTGWIRIHSGLLCRDVPTEDSRGNSADTFRVGDHSQGALTDGMSLRPTEIAAITIERDIHLESLDGAGSGDGPRCVGLIILGVAGHLHESRPCATSSLDRDSAGHDPRQEYPLQTHPALGIRVGRRHFSCVGPRSETRPDREDWDRMAIAGRDDVVTTLP